MRVFRAQSGLEGPRRSAWCISLLLHAIFLLWLFHAPAPEFLAPAFVAHGDQGVFVAHLYWPNQGSNNATESDAGGAATAHHPMPEKTRLTFPQPSKRAKKNVPQKFLTSQNQPDLETISSDQPHQATPAGSPYGTVLDGPLSGYEIRPALPVFSPDPAVDASDLAGAEGDEIVEVTIDEQGTIIEKKVIQSLGLKIDTKVLAALANWATIMIL